MKFLVQPQRYCTAEAGEAGGSVRKIGFKQAFELQERFLVEDNMIELIGHDAAFLEAVVDRVLRETVVVFLPREALFLSRSDNTPVLDEGGC